MPVISVVMPFFNSRRFVSQAVASIREQSFQDLELIAVDDGSSDESDKIVRQHMAEDSRIMLVQCTHNGVAAARNIGIKTARGSFIATMDADDVSLPHRLSCQLTALLNNPELVVIGGGYDVIDEHGRVVSEKSSAHRKPATPYACRKTLEQGGCPLCASTTLIRREAIQRVGGYRPEMDLAEDYDLWLRLARIGEISNVSEKVLQYRVHRTSGTFTNSEVQFAGILRAIIWDKGIHSHLKDKDISELLKIAAGDEDISSFLLNRAIYPIEMAQLGYPSDAVRLAKLFSKYVTEQDRPWVLWQFMTRAVFESAERQRRSLALRLLLEFLINQRLGSLWVNRREIRGLVAFLASKIYCRTTSLPEPQGEAICGYVDTATWIDDGQTLLINGWARFSELGSKPTFLVHLPEPKCQPSIKRTMRPDVADALGHEHLFSGFEIKIDCDGTPARGIGSVPVSIMSATGKRFSLGGSGVLQ